MTGAAQVAGFLARHGYAAADAAPLAQDASFRRYLRLTGGPRPAVLMDAPPPEDVRPFLRIAAHLAGIGLSVPEIIAADEALGLVLEEDFGDALLSSLPPPPLVGLGREADHGLGDGCAPPPSSSGAGRTPPPALLPRGEEGAFCSSSASTSAAFDAAVDALLAMQRAAPPPGLPAWDAPTMAQAALGTLLDWWWPAAFGAAAPDSARADFATALDALLARLTNGPRGFVHRDYFAGNLIWLPQRAGPRRIGILDFQSAALGHPAYDLVSFVQDARRDMPSEMQDRALDRYLAARPELDPAAFRAAFAACAAQRHLRVACQWVRLARRDGRPQYLVHGSRTWRLLDVALRHPVAAPLAAALDRWVPPAMRRNPPSLAA